MDSFTSILDELRLMFDSPIALVTVVVAFWVCLWSGRWWVPAVVALLADGISALVLYKHWLRVGIDFKSQIWHGALLFAILTYSAYVLARLLVYARGYIRRRSR
jgi:hypothetical protein